MTEVKEVNINVPKRAVVINEAPRASARGIFFFACRAAFGDCSHPRAPARGIPAKNNKASVHDLKESTP